jgi:hypothetical protein
MRREYVFEMLAEVLGVTSEALAASMGTDWNTTDATPNMIIRGSDNPGFFFYDDDEPVEIEASYPDVGIKVELPDRIHIGTLEAIYNPAPVGYDIKPLVSLSLRDPIGLDKLKEAIEYVAQVALAEMRACTYCRQELPPYLMSEQGYCYGCGSEKLGIVY